MSEPRKYLRAVVANGCAAVEQMRQGHAVVVQFATKDPDVGTVMWFGSVNDDIPQGATKTWLEMTKEALQLCGWDGKDWGKLDGLTREVEIVVEPHEKYRWKVKFVNDPNRPRVRPPVDPAVIAALNAKTSGGSVVATLRTVAEAGHATSQLTKDDIPF